MFKQGATSLYEELANRYYIDTVKDMVKSTTSINNPFERGQTAFKCKENGSIVSLCTSELSNCTEEHFLNHEGDLEYSNIEGLFSNVTNNILNISSKSTFFEALNIIEKYRVLAGDNFYGAVLRDTNDDSILINPYHILTTLSVLGDKTSLSSEYTILIFFYSSLDSAIINTEITDEESELIDSNIDTLMKLCTEKEEDTTEYEGICVRNDEVSLLYKMQQLSSDLIVKVVATQVITRGILAPYYGVTVLKYIKDEINPFGNHLTPYRSVNIQEVSPMGYDWATVCTGELQKNSFEGLQSLSHSNLSSAYTTSAYVKQTAYIYAKRMIEKSINLYKLAGIIGEPNETQTKEDTSKSCSA